MSGRPVFGSSERNTVWFTYGFPSINRSEPPVRSRKYKYPLRATLIAPLISRPPRRKSTRIGGDTSSQSNDSFGVYCMWLLIFPVATSSATVDAMYRLAPGRWSPIHGPPLPVPQNDVFVSGSYSPVTHTDAPPVFHCSPP